MLYDCQTNRGTDCFGLINLSKLTAKRLKLSVLNLLFMNRNMLMKRRSICAVLWHLPRSS